MKIGIGKRKLEFICKHSKICLTIDKVKTKCSEKYIKNCELYKSYEQYGEGYNHLGV